MPKATSSSSSAAAAKTAKTGKQSTSKTATSTMAATTSSTADDGRPSQPRQTTRKGKKAWRKNIDTGDIDEAMEGARDDERRTGMRVGAGGGKDAALFAVDTKGDARIAAEVRMHTPIAKRRESKPLRSLAILSERSAVPALIGRQTTPTTTTKVMAKDKDRLLRIARKKKIGPDGSGMGSAVIDIKAPVAVRDVWTQGDEEEEAASAPKTAEQQWLPAPKRAPKAPVTVAQQRARAAQLSRAQALPVPAAGTSYNPAIDAHQRLLDAALEEERKKLQRELKEEEKIKLARGLVVQATGYQPGVAIGMQVGDGEQEDSEGGSEEEGDAAGSRVVKPTKRKTQAEKNKRARRLEEERRRKAALANKALAQSLARLPSLRKDVESSLKSRQEAVAARRARRIAAESQMVAGKVGKHHVKEQDVDVQLGEELVEHLREIKPSGNLFRDRFLSLQRRALVEPRVPQLPKRKTTKIKQYEKHPWKRFE